MANSLFKQEHDLEKRRAEAARIREKYLDRIPVIVEKAERSDIPNIDKKNDGCVMLSIFTEQREVRGPEGIFAIITRKFLELHDYAVNLTNLGGHHTCEYLHLYLVPADLTVGQFVYVIRKRIKLSAEKAIFIFVDNVLPPTGAVMSAVYDEKKDEDGFLYVTYSGENTFGNQVML